MSLTIGKRLVALGMLLLVMSTGCKSNQHSNDGAASTDLSANKDRGAANGSTSKIGDPVDILAGHFVSASKVDTISIVWVKEGIDAENKDEYEVRFSSKDRPMHIAKEGGRLIREGDLNGDGLDDFSVFADPHHGCGFTLFTLTHKSGHWKKLIEEFLVPTACDPVSDSELQERVFLKDGVLFYRQEDVGSDSFSIVTKPAKLLE